MKAKDLIAELQKLPPDIDVCIYDWGMNFQSADGEDEGSSLGIYPDFKVEQMKDEELPEGSLPWAALTFQNPDYAPDEDYGDLFDKLNNLKKPL